MLSYNYNIGGKEDVKEIEGWPTFQNSRTKIIGFKKRKIKISFLSF